MGWEIPFKAIGTVLSLVVAYFQVRSFIQGSHSTLKTDLEILNLMSPKNPNYQTVKAYVDENIAKTFYSKKGQPSGKSKLSRDPDFLKGGTIFLFFAFITGYALMTGLTFWAVLPGLVALTGLGGVLAALDRTRGRK